MDTVPEFNTEVPQATVSKGLAQGPYMAARAGIELMTLRTKGVDSTKAPPCPIIMPQIKDTVRIWTKLIKKLIIYAYKIINSLFIQTSYLCYRSTNR